MQIPLTDVFHVLAGFLLGLSFLGGYFLFFIPLGIIALVFGWLNRNSRNGHTITLTKPITERLDRLVRPKSVGTEYVVESEVRETQKENPMPQSSRKVMEDIEAEIDGTLHEALLLVKNLIPHVNTAAIFFPSKTFGQFEMRLFVSGSNVIPKVTLGSGQGVLGALIRKDTVRILEGDIPGGHSLFYYEDDPPICSVAAVPIINQQKTRGFIVIDSLQKNAFTQETITFLKGWSKVVGFLTYQSYISAINQINSAKFDTLYRYQQHFFRTMSPKDIYGHIAEYLRHNLSHDRFMILSRERGEDGAGRVVHAEGIDSDYFINQTFSESDLGILISPLFKNWTQNKYLDLSEGYVLRIRKGEKQNDEFRQILAVPVITDLDSSKAELLIAIESRQHQRYMPQDQELLKHFASAVGFALQRTRQYEEKQELASRDGLTGLINHRTFQEKLRVEKLRADRQQQNIGLMMIDIDKFKGINDNYGHPSGDIVIKSIASLLQKEVRQDIDVVARYGGEEFVVLLVNTNKEGLSETAQRICRAVASRPISIDRVDPLIVTVSIGYYLLTPDFRDAKKALEFADQALYKAKVSGRNRTVEYN